MSNKEKVQKALTDFQTGDIASVVSICDENVDWINPDAPEVPIALSVRGKSNVPKFFGTLADQVDVTSFTVDHFIEEGSRVVSWGSYSAKVKTTGKDFTTPLIMLWEFNNEGKVARWIAQTNTSEQAKAFSNN